MCAGDDHNCPQFELHRQKLLDDLDAERRSFLKSAFVAGGGAAALAAGGGALIQPASAQTRPGQPTYHYLPATDETVHWGYFSKLLKPLLEVDSGDYRHHRDADPSRQRRRRAHGQGRSRRRERLLWDQGQEGRRSPRRRPDRRQAARPRRRRRLRRPHLHRPGLVRGAEPGDILEVRILDVKPRPCANPAYAGKSFGSNAAAWWGFHYKELITEPKPREVITIYEIDATRAAQLGPGGLQFPLDAADRSVRRGAQDHRLSRRAGRPHDGAGEPRHPQERAHPDPPAFRRDGRGAEGSRLSSTRSRPATSAATSTTGASARARPCTTRSRCPAACSRSAIRTPRRATPSCAAPRSNAR